LHCLLQKEEPSLLVTQRSQSSDPQGPASGTRHTPATVLQLLELQSRSVLHGSPTSRAGPQVPVSLSQALPAGQRQPSLQWVPGSKVAHDTDS
jgi:hypothetical protein